MTRYGITTTTWERRWHICRNRGGQKYNNKPPRNRSKLQNSTRSCSRRKVVEFKVVSLSFFLVERGGRTMATMAYILGTGSVGYWIKND